MAEQHPIRSIALRPKVVRSAILVAIVVGTLLNLINQGDALLGDRPVVLWKLILTYMVPYCVSTYGAVMALRNNN